jgi:UDP-GlcNAc:undecaprenyl-phosphate GlcNAc-1-phosphate transferase
MEWFVVFISILTASIGLMFMLRRLALRRNVLAANGIALIGGIGIAGAAGFGLWLSMPMLGADPGQWKILSVAGAMLVFGILDDIREKSIVQKLLLQSLCAAMLIALDVRTHIVFLDHAGNAVVTFLWIMGITNAFNLLDVVDGLSSGVAVIVSAALLVLSFLYSTVSVQAMALGLLAATAGFLFFNIPPATVYLGNAGSHFLGFMLAALALMVSYATGNSPVALLSPVIILGLPILETAGLIYFRSKKKISPLHKSNDHAAFKLLARGWPLAGVLRVMLGFSLLCALAGVVLCLLNGVAAAGVVGCVIVAGAFFFRELMKADKNGG